MKKVISAGFAFVLAMGLAIAANAPLRETIKVPIEQVPVSVRNAFEKDFGTAPDGGYWTALVEKEASNGRTIVTPINYSFVKKVKGNKIEVKYTPTGTLESFSGLEKIAPVADATAVPN
jgi:hypothetical protein